MKSWLLFGQNSVYLLQTKEGEELCVDFFPYGSLRDKFVDNCSVLLQRPIDKSDAAISISTCTSLAWHLQKYEASILGNCIQWSLCHIFLHSRWQKTERFISQRSGTQWFICCCLQRLGGLFIVISPPQVIPLAGFWNGWRLMPPPWDSASSSLVAAGWINRRMTELLRELSTLQSCRQWSTSHVSRVPFPQDTPLIAEDKNLTISCSFTGFASPLNRLWKIYK